MSHLFLLGTWHVKGQESFPERGHLSRVSEGWTGVSLTTENIWFLWDVSINTKIAHQNSKTASWDTRSLGMTRSEITGLEPYKAAQIPVQGMWEEKSWGLHPVAAVSVTSDSSWPHAASRASLSFAVSWSLLKLMSIEPMPSNRLISPSGAETLSPLFVTLLWCLCS